MPIGPRRPGFIELVATAIKKVWNKIFKKKKS
jgi:hypothetical protein